MKIAFSTGSSSRVVLGEYLLIYDEEEEEDPIIKRYRVVSVLQDPLEDGEDGYFEYRLREVPE